MGAKRWLLIYLVMMIIFVLIILYIATDKKKITYDRDNGADRLIILSGIDSDDRTDEENSSSLTNTGITNDSQ